MLILSLMATNFVYFMFSSICVNTYRDSRKTTYYFDVFHGQSSFKSIFNRKKFKYNNEVYFLYTSGTRTNITLC